MIFIKSNGATNNWYNQAEWIDSEHSDFVQDLRTQFILQGEFEPIILVPI